MTPITHEEPDLNTLLAKLLHARMSNWDVQPHPNNVFVQSTKTPDMLFRRPDGQTLLAECKYKASRRDLDKQAKSHLGRELAYGQTAPGVFVVEQVIMVVYPDELKTDSSSDLTPRLKDAILDFAVVAEGPRSSGEAVRFPFDGWLSGSVNDLIDFVELVAQAERKMSAVLERYMSAVNGAAHHLASGGDAAGSFVSAVANLLHQEKGEQTSKMAMSIILNALVTHDAIAPQLEVVQSPGQLTDAAEALLHRDELLEAWNSILKVDYWPIFGLAKDIVNCIPSATDATSVLTRLWTGAQQLSVSGPHGTQDLGGQVFGRLISDRKFLATFYTRPASAALLAELACSRLSNDWGSRRSVGSLRIADLACGTGTLLAAVYRRVASRCRGAGLEPRDVHAKLIEDCFIGADIMPAAVHLTTAALSAEQPTIPYRDTRTHIMPYGKQPNGSVAIGSLKLIQDPKSPSLFFGTGSLQVSGTNTRPTRQLECPHNSLNLAIMNPPFTRSTKHDAESQGVPIPTFAGFGTAEQEQRLMAKQLEQLYGKVPFSPAGHGNVGLGSHFLDLATRKLRRGGVLAFVLPSSLTAGSDWHSARELLRTHYDDVCVVSISGPTAKESSFSADTDLAEVLVLATRRKTPRRGTKTETSKSTWTWVTLDHKPSSVVEAVQTAKAIVQAPLEDGALKLGSNAVGRVRLGSSSSRYSQIQDTSLMDITDSLIEQDAPVIALPRASDTISFNLCRLGAIGHRGLYHLDIRAQPPRGPFDIEERKQGWAHSAADYPTLWWLKSEVHSTFEVEPNAEALVRSAMKSKAQNQWKTATRLHLALESSWQLQPLIACLTPEESLGGRSWPSYKLFSWDELGGSDRQVDQLSEREKSAMMKRATERMSWVYPVLLWVNSTLGMMSWWRSSNKSQGSRGTWTISRLPDLRVLDPRRLSTEQLDRAEDIYNRISQRHFLPAASAGTDPARLELDHALLVELLDLPESTLDGLERIRARWCAEPTVSGDE